MRARVRYVAGEQILAEYETCYGEYFQFGEGETLPADLHDVHDFCVHRDAWTPKRLRDLLRREGLLAGRRLPCAGEPRVECRKEFRLGLGRVEDATPAVETSDGAFGFLKTGPFARAEASLWLHLGAGKRLRPAPFPFQRAGAGRGRFTGDRGWLATESYTYRFATSSGVLRGAGYQPWLPGLPPA